jgi:peptidyl-prolyl cis-trans isomerase C
MSFSKRSSLIIVIIAAVIAVSGCDMIKPKNKNKPLTQNKIAPTATEEVLVTTPTDTNSAQNNEQLPKNVLAKVGTWTITLDEYKDRLEGVKKVMKEFDEKVPGAKEMLLDDIIRQQLLVYEARQQKIDQLPDIQGAVKDFENTLLVQELAGRLTQGIKVTEEEAREYYNANPDVFVMPVEKQLREIVVPTEVEAKDILVQVLQGADFVQMAKDKSKGKTADKGGDLGFVAKAPLEQMQKETETLKKGEVSRVFSGPDGYYIVKVDDVRGGDKKAFDEIKEDLIKGLTLQKQQRVVLEKMSEVAKKINVKVNADLLKE